MGLGWPLLASFPILIQFTENPAQETLPLPKQTRSVPEKAKRYWSQMFHLVLRPISLAALLMFHLVLRPISLAALLMLHSSVSVKAILIFTALRIVLPQQL